MKISTKGRYALRFMLELAAHGDGKYVPLKEISAKQEVSLKYLEQIVSQFGKLGLLESVRGATGRLSSGESAEGLHRGRDSALCGR